MRRVLALVALILTLAVGAPGCQSVQDDITKTIAGATDNLDLFGRPEILHEEVYLLMMPNIDEFAPGAIGVTFPFWERPQIIGIRPDLPQPLQRRVVAHELMHALGFTGVHGSDPDGYFHAYGKNIPCGDPSPAEIRAVRRVERVYTVRCISPELDADLLWSVEMWNRWAGKTILRIEAYDPFVEAGDNPIFVKTPGMPGWFFQDDTIEITEADGFYRDPSDY
jgi:hypothetical protein